ncbi:MAG: hypothetical protein U0168_30300 [Nannocystaceae bacterium]
MGASSTVDPIALLVRELLLARTEGLSPPQLAAFIQGWTSALELLRRSDLTAPDADAAVHRQVAEVLARIDAVTRDVLGDGDEHA